VAVRTGATHLGDVIGTQDSLTGSVKVCRILGRRRRITCCDKRQRCCSLPKSCTIIVHLPTLSDICTVSNWGGWGRQHMSVRTGILDKRAHRVRRAPQGVARLRGALVCEEVHLQVKHFDGKHFQRCSTAHASALHCCLQPLPEKHHPDSMHQLLSHVTITSEDG